MYGKMKDIRIHMGPTNCGIDCELVDVFEH